MFYTEKMLKGKKWIYLKRLTNLSVCFKDQNLYKCLYQQQTHADINCFLHYSIPLHVLPIKPNVYLFYQLCFQMYTPCQFVTSVSEPIDNNCVLCTQRIQDKRNSASNDYISRNLRDKRMEI